MHRNKKKLLRIHNCGYSMIHKSNIITKTPIHCGVTSETGYLYERHPSSHKEGC